MKIKVTLVAAFVAVSLMLSGQWIQVNTISFHIQPGTLAALGADTVIVAADNGNIHLSNDGGQTFSKDSLPFPYSWWHDVHFPSKTTGYVCGGTAFGPVQSPIGKTTDGGLTWDSLSGNQFGYDLYCVFFTDENTGYFGGQNMIIKTTDGGQTFAVDSLTFGWQVRDIFFIDATTGFYLSSPNIYRTTDGAQTWTIVFTDTVPSFVPGFNKIQFTDAQVGFALSQFGDLVKTTDGGNTWAYSTTLPDTAFIQDFDFLDRNIGYAVSTANQIGSIYKTTDGGQSWFLQHTDTTEYLVKVDMLNQDEGYVLGQTKILATTNGGVDLKERILPVLMDIYPNPASDYFILKMQAGVKMEKLALRDVSGREVRTWSAPAESYSVAGLPPGVYFIEVKSSEGTISERLVVE